MTLVLKKEKTGPRNESDIVLATFILPATQVFIFLCPLKSKLVCTYPINVHSYVH